MKDTAHVAASASLPRGDDSAPRADPDAVRQISLVEALNVLLRWRLLIILVPSLIVAVVVGYTLLQPRTFTASTSFLPQSTTGSRSGMAGIAAQFGLAMPAGQPDESPQFYADLVRSHEILGTLADSVYRTTTGQPGRLADILRVRGESPAAIREATIEKLSANTSVAASAQTGIVRISVSTPDRAVSQQVAARFVKLINDFNLRRRQSRAGAERTFVQERLNVARADLSAAEGRLSEFLERNRQMSNAPELHLVRDRLERAVSMQQQVFTTLAQSYEQARIDEVRNIPVITVIEEPVQPLKPASRKVVTKALVALILGLVLATIAAFLAEFTWRARRNDEDEYREFAELWRDTLWDIRHPFMRLRGVPRR